MLRGWGFSSFYRSVGQGFELSFCPGVGNSPIKKNCLGVLPWGGGWSCDFMNDFHEIVKRACSF